MEARAIEMAGSNQSKRKPVVDLGAVRGIVRSYLPALFLLLVILTCATFFSPFASAAEGKIVSADVSAEASSNLRERNNVAHEATASFQLAPLLRVTDTLNLSAAATVENELTGKRETHLRNTTLGLRRKPWAMTEALSFSPGMSATLPTDDKARRRSSLIVGAAVVPRILIDMAPAGMEWLSGHVQMSASRNLHQFKTATTGDSNRQWGLTPLAKISAAISRKLSITTTASYAMRWTYGGNRVDDFELSEEVSWQTGSDMAIGIGHSNAGSAQRADGLGSNVEFFDANSSNIFANVTVSI